ncbi:hypothetical protein DY000_02034752 [Brassica cretica]|uniref:Uncharacterized protein n=1 Tax=Brassica cretica TaxID=69181 RepID=A0ABQ7DKT6_BRACR|nr:hypothetical protein DY000_02034752 [Brassica cretica]
MKRIDGVRSIANVTKNIFVSKQLVFKKFSGLNEKVESISCIRRHEKGSICLPVNTIELLSPKFRKKNDIECLRNLRNRIKGSTDQEPQSPVAEDQVVKKMNHMVTSLANTFKSPLVDTIQSILQHQQIVVCSAAKAFRESKKDISIALLPRIIFIE